jgi:hypothetical protein
MANELQKQKALPAAGRPERLWLLNRYINEMNASVFQPDAQFIRNEVEPFLMTVDFMRKRNHLLEIGVGFMRIRVNGRKQSVEVGFGSKIADGLF